MITALVVTGTHCLWVVYGHNPPLEWPLNFLVEASTCGVCIFFAISGYLITSSLIERPGMLRYTFARILRLCPLLFLASLIMAFNVGPLVSTASFADYYGDWRVWAYVPLTSFAYPDMTLPGVFTALPSQGEVNISIWTLRYEMIAYVLMGIIAALGLLQHRFFAVFVGFATLVYLLITYGTTLRGEIPFLLHGFRFGMIFLIGSVLYRYRSQIPINFWGVIIVITFAYLTNNLPLKEPFRLMALSYSAIWFALKAPPILQRYNRFGDYSYGIFVFHWPIAQTIFLLNPTISYSSLLMIVVPLALLLAIVSWHLIEEPLLERAPYWAKKMKSYFAPSSPVSQSVRVTPYRQHPPHLYQR